MVITYGFIFMKGWNWFIQPTFWFLPTLTLVQSIGVSLFVSFNKSKKINSDKDLEDQLSETAERLLQLWVIFGFMALIYWFINM